MKSFSAIAIASQLHAPTPPTVLSHSALSTSWIVRLCSTVSSVAPTALPGAPDKGFAVRSTVEPVS